jgi:hypothetical protein
MTAPRSRRAVVASVALLLTPLWLLIANIAV